MILQLSSIVLLIALSAVFSSSETAFTSLSSFQVEHLAQSKGPSGRMVRRLSERPDTLLTTILFGNNLVNISASAVATQFTIELFGSQAVGIMTGILTLVVLIFAEITPKQLALFHNEALAITMAYPIYILSVVLYPFIKLIGSISHLITRLFSRKKRRKISLEGILHMVHLAEREGVVENYETRMVKSVFRFNDTQVQTIMTHRTDIFSLDEGEQIDDVLDEITQNGYSRIPLYEKNPEHITGILLVRDLMREVASGHRDTALREIAIHPLFVSETRKVNELFFLFKREKLNMAVVMDEYGGLAGIVTLEDVAEELFGEIYDENETKGWEKITNLGDGSYRITGDTSLHQIKDRFGIEFDHTKYVQTVGGFLIEYLGTLPVKNQKVETQKGSFKIESLRKNRIRSVLYRPAKQEGGH
jgi:putative hemolysin